VALARKYGVKLTADSEDNKKHFASVRALARFVAAQAPGYPVTAVDGLTFTVAPGRVTGLVGPEGAGKSTTVRMILGLDTPDAGEALIGGRPYARLRHPLCEVGALLDAGAVHPYRRGRDHLRWLAHSHGLPAGRVDELLEQVGLATAARRPAGEFSPGIPQRLGIAPALLGDPQVLLFDEPVTGLDAEDLRWLRDLLRSLAAQGRAVLVASRLMSELEDTADHLVVIGRGRLIAGAVLRDGRAPGDTGGGVHGTDRAPS
jgi:ABC-2 type transport system ATP-binding protein